MHGLKEAEKLAHENLKTLLKPHGYEPTKCMPGLRQHETSELTFTLIIDNFGMKHTYVSRAQHLLENLRLKHKVSTDWTGSLCAGITID